MRFLPTVDLWAPGVSTALHFRQLRLQTGQWVLCGNSRHPSRFVCVTPSGASVWAAHWQGSAKATREHFRKLLQVARDCGYVKPRTAHRPA